MRFIVCSILIMLSGVAAGIASENLAVLAAVHLGLFAIIIAINPKDESRP